MSLSVKLPTIPLAPKSDWFRNKGACWADFVIVAWICCMLVYMLGTLKKSFKEEKYQKRCATSMSLEFFLIKKYLVQIVSYKRCWLMARTVSRMHLFCCQFILVLYIQSITTTAFFWQNLLKGYLKSQVYYSSYFNWANSLF